MSAERGGEAPRAEPCADCARPRGSFVRIDAEGDQGEVAARLITLADNRILSPSRVSPQILGQ